MTFKSGFIALIGRPNVGKSTLINQIFKQKIAIVSDKVQTTRNSIRGILNDETYQLVFIDTPGIHVPKDEMGRFLNRESFNQLEGIDLVYFIIDGSSNFGPQDTKILERLNQEGAPIFLIVNKIDTLSKSLLIEKLASLSQLNDFAEIIPISALENDNVDRLLEITLDYLPEGPAYFKQDEEKLVDYQQNFLLTELIREKVLYFTRDEIPHQVACVIENIQEQEDRVYIQAAIIVQSESQKPILIGKGGSMIKKIRQQAQRDIQRALNKSCELELFIKVEKDWRTKPSKLSDYGYSDE